MVITVRRMRHGIRVGKQRGAGICRDGRYRVFAWAVGTLGYLRAVQFKQVAILGVGLLGGSLGLALRQRQLAGRVVGCVRRARSVGECRRVGAVDAATLDWAAAVAGSDLVVFCTPIAQMAPLFRQLAPHFQRGALVTDVGSVKGSVVRELEPLARRAGVHFIGSHPMAGSEKTGVLAARGDLYEGAVCVVTPTARTTAAVVRRTEKLWRAVGARVVEMSPARHDRLVARSSHLPHLVASQLVQHTLGGASDSLRVLCATGFRDTTRVASGSPEMWRDIAVANAKNLSREVARFRCALARLEAVLRRGEADALAEFFATAKARRDAWCAGNRFTSPE